MMGYVIWVGDAIVARVFSNTPPMAPVGSLMNNVPMGIIVHSRKTRADIFFMMMLVGLVERVAE